MKPYTGERLPVWREICYGGGTFTASLFGTIIGTWLSFFYIDTLGFDSRAIGAAMIIYSLWNAVNDPIMGYLSDRTRTKLGRRLPYVLFGAVPLGVSFVFIFSPPTAGLTTPMSQILYYTLSLCVYDFFFTTVLLNWEAVVPAMYPKEKDRGRILGIAQVFDILGGVVAALAIQPVFEQYGWPAMALIFGAVGIVTMLISVLGIRENPKHSQVEPLRLLDSFKQTFKSRAFVICVLGVFFVETARLLLMASIPYFAKYVFPDVEMAATLFTAAVFISALLFTPLAIFISNRKGVKFTYILCLLWFALIAALFITGRSFTFCLVLCVLMGFGVTGGIIMPKLLSAEIIDEDQTVTGQRREGAFFGTHAFIIRFAAGLQAVLLSAVMRGFGYIEGAAAQAGSAVTGFRVSMSLIPAVLVGLGALIITRYPLHGERLAAVKAKIAELEKPVSPADE
ncbi:MAG: MFS transporter [Oscillospiraceae bacterium]|jgi:GPH family glycoside/pentoside/hexuronide:cation symporter|nr:MFS transporter [Oscillospiraceae bacterium]